MNELLSRIRHDFPELKWRHARLETEGWDHSAVILDNAMLFRIPKVEVAPGYFDREIAVLELVRRHTTVQIPNVSHVSSDRTIIGYPYLQGVQLNLTTLATLDEQGFELVCEQLSQFLNNLSGIPTDECRRLDVPVRRPQDVVAWLSSGLRNQLRQKLTEQDCQIVEAFLVTLESSMSSCPKDVPIHGDLGLDAMLLDPAQKQLAIIDFSNFAIGDPAFDFQGILSGSPRLARAVLARYGPASECGDILGRAAVNNKMIPIALMIHALLGNPADFDEAYRNFRSQFRLRETGTQ